MNANSIRKVSKFDEIFATNGDESIFVSLKWKVLILSSLLLIGITATISSLNYVSLIALYESQRDNAFQKYTLQVDGLLSRSGQNLQSLASMITNILEVKNAIHTNDFDKLQVIIDQHWLSLQIDSGIETLQFYDQANKLILNQSLADEELLGGRVWVSRVNVSEQPVTFIECNVTCMQMSVVPVLIQGEHVGVIVVARSLADAVLDLKNITGSDIGVLIRSSDDKINSRQRYLDRWGYRIIAFTNWETSAGRMHYADAHYSLANSDQEPINMLFGQQNYEIRSYILGDEFSNVNFVVLTDVTSEIASIRADNIRNISISLLGWVVAEILLLGLLWRPMNRLKTTALALPLLSERKYEQARQSVKESESWLHVDDETDVLVETTLRLANQLEHYHVELQMHLKNMALHVAQIESQKDFVTNLIQTANSIIITQNSFGEILTINDYGKELLGVPSSDLVGAPFTRIIATDSLTTNVYRDVADLNAGRRTRLNHELTVRVDGESVRHIAWYHSRMTETGDLGASIITVGHDITERIEAEKSLSWLADHDSLTGMINRRHFHNILGTAITSASRLGAGGAMLFLDLDQFKDVNDSSGHQAGDLLLREVAGKILAAVSGLGEAARIGGDEFAVLLNKVDKQQAIDCARNILTYLAQISLPINNRVFTVSASIGIAMFPEHGKTSIDIFSSADLAMYQAKENGRGCWYLYSPTEKIRERLNERVYWRGVLDKALEHDLFQLYYQPIADVKSRDVQHYEALLRYVDTDGLVHPPSSIIAIAESSGLIHKIDRLVVAKAIRQLTLLQNSGVDVSFAINLSAHAFLDPGLFEMIRSMIVEIGLDASKLIFEVTETAAIADFTIAQAYIVSIKELGCRFALDDFGVGFSSFYSLKHLPVDYVKIDGSFIKSLHSNKEDQVLVRSLSQAAQGFGKKTIAEFVEDELSHNKLNDYDVDYAQGYFIGRPLPAAEAFTV